MYIAARGKCNFYRESLAIFVAIVYVAREKGRSFTVHGDHASDYRRYPVAIICNFCMEVLCVMMNIMEWGCSESSFEGLGHFHFEKDTLYIF